MGTKKNKINNMKKTDFEFTDNKIKKYINKLCIHNYSIFRNDKNFDNNSRIIFLPIKLENIKNSNYVFTLYIRGNDTITLGFINYDDRHFKHKTFRELVPFNNYNIRSTKKNRKYDKLIIDIKNEIINRSEDIFLSKEEYGNRKVLEEIVNKFE